jgi:hypothetical protein
VAIDLNFFVLNKIIKNNKEKEIKNLLTGWYFLTK